MITVIVFLTLNFYQEKNYLRCATVDGKLHPILSVCFIMRLDDCSCMYMIMIRIVPVI